ncbi:unnamed protein product [Symbiodinium sp. CCMP2592]|nr:unnamed protein product [Symbiodinium sp. CCMP2592]
MSDVRTSFYGSTWVSSGDVPPGPSDDSPQQHSDGVAADRGDAGDGPVSHDVHGAGERDDDWTRDDPWSKGRSGDQAAAWWGHSEWGSYAHWDSRGEPWDTRWQNHERVWHDRRQSYGGTWGSTSTGTGSVHESPSRDYDHQEQGAEAWRTRGGAAMPGGWQPQKLGCDLTSAPKTGESARGPSEKMVVPSFAGALEAGTEDIGASARSYLRQIAAWRRMTRIDSSRQALTLYQHLSGKAWIDAERLDVDKLAGEDGMEYYLSWVTDRYLDVQVTQIGRSLGDFFRRLRRQQGQSVRDYMSDYDRALARLQECGCHLPDIAAAWVFVDRMALSEEQELNLLASVQNEYSLKRLQQAAIVQDRSLRKPWEPNNSSQRQDRGSKWWSSRRPQQANMADDGHPDEDDPGDLFPTDDQSECVPEHVAEELFEAFMTHESAKQKYKELSKLRGADPEGMRQLAADRLQQAKNKSFCSGCRRRGHWHKDPECPLNQGGGNGAISKGLKSSPPNANKDDVPKTSYACHYVYVTWDLDQKVATANLTAITDTACSRSVAGVPWIEKYMVEARKIGFVPETVMCKDAFKFGASRIFDSSYAVVLSFGVGGHSILLRVAVVNGDVPLLISRPALGQLGMIMDVAANKASFRNLGVQDLSLLSTDTGHPDRELLIVPKSQQYTAFMTAHSCESSDDDESACRVEAPPLLPGLSVNSAESPQVTTSPKVFYPKKISIEASNLLTSDKMNPTSFMAWWSQTSISNDFWIEDEFQLHRIHVVPRRTFFDPRGWATSKGDQKSALLEALGPSRVRLRSNLMASSAQLLTAPVVTKKKGLWELRREELIAEANARGLMTHPKWTVPELRSIIQEDMKKSSAASSGTPFEATPLTKMTVKDLENALEASGMAVPEKANKGVLMRLLRDQGGLGPQTVLSFGRFRGQMYQETPISYRRWAVREVAGNNGAQEDLRMYATWAAKALEVTDGYMASSTPTPFPDSEESAKVPYHPESFGGSSWDLVPTGETNDYKIKSKAKARPTKVPAEAETTRVPAQRRGPSSVAPSSTSRMEQEVDPEVMDEVQYLQARLAVLQVFYDCDDFAPNANLGKHGGGNYEAGRDQHCGSSKVLTQADGDRPEGMKLRPLNVIAIPWDYPDYLAVIFKLLAAVVLPDGLAADSLVSEMAVFTLVILVLTWHSTKSSRRSTYKMSPQAVGFQLTAQDDSSRKLLLPLSKKSDSLWKSYVIYYL